MKQFIKGKRSLSRRTLSFATSALCLFAINVHASSDKVKFTERFDNTAQLDQVLSTKNIKTIAGEVKLDQQSPYYFDKSVFIPKEQAIHEVQFADINGDNKTDVLVMDHHAGIVYSYIQQNNNTFIKSSLLTGDRYCSMTVFDIDKDNDMDIITSSIGAKLSINKNNGDGTFVEDTQYASHVSKDCVEELKHADLNKDKVDDLVFSFWVDGDDSILLNDGTGKFPTKQKIKDKDTKYTHAIDINNDGLLDILAEDVNSYLQRVFINKSQGQVLQFEEVITPQYQRELVYASDLDGDTKKDYVFKNYDSTPTRLEIVMGDGTAAPLNNAGKFSKAPSDMLVVDFNNDKKANEIITTHSQSTGRAYLEYSLIDNWQNKENEIDISKTSRKIIESSHFGAFYNMQFIDMNNDGLKDVVSWHYDGVEIFFASNTSSYIDTTFPFSSLHAEFIDINKDGKSELFSIRSDKSSEIYSQVFNETIFSPSSSLSLSKLRKTQFADINGDGRQDIVAIKDSGQDAIFLANEKGDYVTETLLGTADDAKSHTKKHFITDLNNDGLKDIIAIKENAESLIYLQKASGKGEFEAAALFIYLEKDTNQTIRSRKIADIALLKQHNEHGLASIAISYYDEKDAAYGTSFLSQKTSNVFNEERQFRSPTVISIESYDLNNDGNRDVLSIVNGAIIIYYMDDKYDDINTKFIAFNNNDANVVDLALHDINHDNKLDILVVSNNADSAVYLYNKKSDHYALDTHLLPKFKDSTFYVDIQDIDNDGDADIIYDTGKSPHGEYSDEQIISTYKGVGGYLNPQTVTSNTIDTQGAPLSVIKLSADVTNTANNFIDYYLSDNNGTNWYQVEPEQFLTFPTTPTSGSGLKWKVTLRSSVGQSPTLNGITLTGKQSQIITAALPASAEFDQSIVFAPTASSGLPVSVSIKASSIHNCDYNNGKLLFADVGQCVLELSQSGNDDYLAVREEKTIQVNPKTITLAFKPITNKVYGDGPFNITVTTNDHSAPIELSSTTPQTCIVEKYTIDAGNNAVASPVSMLKPGTCSITANQLDGGNTAPATKSYSFDIAKGTRTSLYPYDFIEFRQSTEHNMIAGPMSQPLPLKMTVTSKTPDICSAKVATIPDLTFTQFKKAGECEAEITFAEDAYFVESKTIAKLTVLPTVLDLNKHIEPPLDTVYKSGQTLPINLSVGSSAAHPNASIHYTSKTPKVCTIVNGKIAFVGAGTCTITASLSGQNSYLADTQDFSFDIAKAAQAIILPSIADIPFSTMPVAFNAKADSGLPVTLKSTSPITCEIQNNQIVTLDIGVCSIEITQAGDANYLAAKKASVSLKVVPGAQVITFPNIGNQYLERASVDLKATASSNLAVSYSTNSKHCQINGNRVTLVSVGSCTVDANQPGNDKFKAATKKTQTFSILATPITPDPEPGVIVVKESKVTVQENESFVEIELRRIGGAFGTIKANFALKDGTAIANKDYVFKSESISFANDELSKTISIKLIDNDQYQGDRDFMFNLTSGQIGATNKTTTVTIIEDDKKPSEGVVNFAESAVSVNEGDKTVSLELIRTGGSAGELNVNYASADGTAKSPHDYQQASGSITFADGEVSKFISLKVIDDEHYENEEYFTVSLNLVQQRSRIATSSIKVTITDNDQKPEQSVINFEQASYSVAEDKGQLSIVVNRTKNIESETRVNVITHDLTALSGSDYKGLNTQLIFKQGEATKTLTISLLDDDVYEGEEQFQVTLLKPQNALLGEQLKATVAIIDNETPPKSGVIGFSGATYEVNEDAQTIEIPLVRTDGIAVTVKTLDGTALKGDDYQEQVWTLTFQDQEVSKNITVNVIDDVVAETDEYLELVLSTTENSEILGEVTQSKLIILDNDPIAETGFVELAKSVYQVDESNDAITVELIRKNGTDGELIVTLATVSGTATEGEDFDALETLIYFADGQSSKAVSINLYQDEDYEGDEQFSVKLSAEENVLGQVTQATVNIIEDDARPNAGSFSLDTNAYTFIKDQKQLIFTVNRTGGTYGEVSVNYTIQEATTAFNIAEALASGTVVFSDGQTVQAVSVSLTKAVDNITVSLSNAVGAELGSTPSLELEAKPEIIPSKKGAGGSMAWLILLLMAMSLVQKRCYTR